MKNTKFLLSITRNISKYEKLTIKGVVEWKDKEIERIKEYIA